MGSVLPDPGPLTKPRLGGRGAAAVQMAGGVFLPSHCLRAFEWKDLDLDLEGQDGQRRVLLPSVSVIFKKRRHGKHAPSCLVGLGLLQAAGNTQQPHNTAIRAVRSGLGPLKRCGGT